MSNVCIVLAGGLGTRLRSAVPHLPKCLAPIGGLPFLRWQLQSLRERGVDRFVMALGYGAEQVREALSQPWARQLTIVCVAEPEALGTGGAARFALAQVGLEEALVVNGDTFLGGSLSPMLSPLDLGSGEFMRMATVNAVDRSRFGGVVVDADTRRVTSFLEKGQTDAGAINAGLYRIHRRAFGDVPPGGFSLETFLLPKLVTEGALQARALAGPFIDIGVPEDYRLFDERHLEYVSQA